jgi:predicted SAM-dependent methyltransferase
MNRPHTASQRHDAEIARPVASNQAARPRLLNLGCGHRFHPAWINIDRVASDRGILAHDLTRGIPLPDASVDGVYHSHLFEHLRPYEGRFLLSECYRVLVPGGVVRVAVPDLEGICTAYLAALNRCLKGGDDTARLALEWMRFELLDQMVRERSGGEMLGYLESHSEEELAFALARIGDEGRSILSARQANLNQRGDGQPKPTRVTPAPRRVGKWARDRLLELLAGREAPRLLVAARFRESGEVHRWMFDRLSLTEAIEGAGFQAVTVCSAGQSRIPGFASFHLEITPDGAVAKPDSLFVEAIRPAAGPPETQR